MKKRLSIILAISSIFALTSCDILNNLMPNTPMRRSSKEESGITENSSSINNDKTSSEHRHKYGSWITSIAPTCVDAGIEKRRCDCGDVQSREIPALGHSFDVYLGTTATRL